MRYVKLNNLRTMIDFIVYEVSEFGILYISILLYLSINFALSLYALACAVILKVVLF